MRTSESNLQLGLGMLAANAGRRLLLGIAFTAIAGAAGLAGCRGSGSNNTTVAAAQTSATDPAEANLAPTNPSGSDFGGGSPQVLSAAQQEQPLQSSQTYRQPAPIVRQSPPAQPGDETYSNNNNSYPSNNSYPGNNSDQGYAPNPDQGYSDQSYANTPDQSYEDPADQAAQAGYDATLTDEQADQPPPPLPVYDQPEAPYPNVIWTPGYWAFGPYGYYWVPGAWCDPPYVGALWTPGYWVFYDNRYRFHHGFWGPHIGYYGGVNYGYGYVGYGYYGGYWNGRDFYYNRNFNRVHPEIHNVYVRNVVVNNVRYDSYEANHRNYNRVSYNGGNGIRATPRPAELAVLREQRIPPMQSQVRAAHDAGQNRQQFYVANHGNPAIAAAPRPFSAERGIAPPPRTTADLPRPGMQMRPAQPDNRPGQPSQQLRPFGEPTQQVRPSAGQPMQPAPQVRPFDNRVGQPMQQVRPQDNRPGGLVQPGQTGTINQQRPQWQPPQQIQPQRPVEQVRPQQQPQVRPQFQQQPAPHYQQQVRPQVQQMQPRPQPQFQQQVRPQPQPEMRPQPQMQMRPQPQPPPQFHPQPPPQFHPQPQPQFHPQPQPQMQRPQENHPGR